MLTREIMGGIALAILWVNTLLVAAAALKDLRDIARRMRELGPLRRAKVVRGDGKGGALAGSRVEQVGRAAAGKGDAIVFHDRSYSGEIYGGAVALEDGGREITIAPAVDAEVWVSREDMDAAAACPSEARFDEAYPHARKARGYSRTAEARIQDGRAVWLGGEDPAAPRLVAATDPRAWARASMARCAAFAVAEVLAAAGCTAVALWPPAFGLVSTIGGALCLAFFLLVQPAGVAVRESVRPPSRRILRGRWERRSAALAAASPSGT